MVPYVIDRIEQGCEPDAVITAPGTRDSYPINIELGMELLQLALDDEQLADTLDGHTVIHMIPDDPGASACNLTYARRAAARGERILTVHWKRRELEPSGVTMDAAGSVVRDESGNQQSIRSQYQAHPPTLISSG